MNKELNLIKKFDSNPDIIKNYNLLQQLGVISLIQDLNSEIIKLEEINSLAVELFNKDNINELFESIVKHMLDKFIPSHLAFIIQEELSPDNSYVISYDNLKLVDSKINVSSLKPYKDFFALSPTSIKFDAFKHMIENEALTDIFIPLKPELIVPLMGHDALYGLIIIGSKVIGSEYSEFELSYINKMMSFASVSLQNYINHKRSIFDNKTKLYTHNYFIKKLNEELKRIVRFKTKISLLMLDIDKFKNINDVYGHLAGDLVLIDTAAIIKNEIRNIDVAARFGGEEFVVMLLECTEESSFRAAERIRNAIKEHEIEYEKNNIKVTISIGISFANFDGIISADQLIEQADHALYFSKKNGRDQTNIYNDKMNISDNK